MVKSLGYQGSCTGNLTYGTILLPCVRLDTARWSNPVRNNNRAFVLIRREGGEQLPIGLTPFGRVSASEIDGSMRLSCERFPVPHHFLVL